MKREWTGIDRLRMDKFFQVSAESAGDMFSEARLCQRERFKEQI